MDDPTVNWDDDTPNLSADDDGLSLLTDSDGCGGESLYGGAPPPA